MTPQRTAARRCRSPRSSSHCWRRWAPGRCGSSPRNRPPLRRSRSAGSRRRHLPSHRCTSSRRRRHRPRWSAPRFRHRGSRRRPRWRRRPSNRHRHHPRPRHRTRSRPHRRPPHRWCGRSCPTCRSGRSSRGGPFRAAIPPTRARVPDRSSPPRRTSTAVRPYRKDRTREQPRLDDPGRRPARGAGHRVQSAAVHPTSQDLLLDAVEAHAEQQRDVRKSTHAE